MPRNKESLAIHLIQKLFPVNKHKRTATSLGYEMSADNGLTKTRRSREDTEIMNEVFRRWLLAAILSTSPWKEYDRLAGAMRLSSSTSFTPCSTNSS